MKAIRRILALAATTAAVLVGNNALAGDCHCGCDDCGMVCKLVETKREIVVTCYGCECAEICVPGKSEKCDTYCETACADGCKAGCGCDHQPLCRIRWTDWVPGCAKVKHIKKLTKYEVTKEVCGYKWEVVHGCECNGLAADRVKPAPPGAKLGDEFPLVDAELEQFMPAPQVSNSHVGLPSSRREQAPGAPTTLKVSAR
jgi:hypothetical protein